MTTHFALLNALISLTLNFLLCNGQGNYAQLAFGVIRAMAGVITKGEERIRDLTEADDLFEGLTYDLYDEKVTCNLMGGILLKQYATVIDNFALSHSIPEDIKHSLLEAENLKNLQKSVHNFKFQKGKTGSYVFGRFSTMKRDGEMDVAYSLYTLDFKLSPKVVEHEKIQKLAWFTTGTTVWRETEERNLSQNEKNKLHDYLKHKAISKFRSEYAHLLEDKSINTSRDEL